MSVAVQQVSKVFGQQRALHAISFSVQPGEIVGFLGPNGAGKSTTMKIMTGYVPATEGNVTIAGLNVNEQPLAVRRLIGYLPEHNPLYLDMYVHEFLQYMGRVHGMAGSVLRSRVADMVALCGLTAEQNKRIESLSKGYRQRVGLAQALLHEPEVLVLDEPTTGLDPNQIIEIRQLIKDISKNKTVIFSTHIMQEVQALCNRVIVINKGHIVADDTVANLLTQSQGQRTFRAEFETTVALEHLQQIPGVTAVTEAGANIYRLYSAEGADVRAAVFRFAADHQLSLVGLQAEEHSLEHIFKELTQTPAAS